MPAADVFRKQVPGVPPGINVHTLQPAVAVHKSQHALGVAAFRLVTGFKSFPSKSVWFSVTHDAAAVAMRKGSMSIVEVVIV